MYLLVVRYTPGWLWGLHLIVWVLIVLLDCLCLRFDVFCLIAFVYFDCISFGILLFVSCFSVLVLCCFCFWVFCLMGWYFTIRLGFSDGCIDYFDCFGLIVWVFTWFRFLLLFVVLS